MIAIRRANERGYVNHGWLESYHTFSFGSYRDRRHMGFRALRVINDDVVAPGRGFGTHPHDNMEIVTYVLDGALEHKDSMGTGSVLRPGDVQRMSAGTGVTHSELNHSQDETLRLLQIWLRPERQGIAPSYEERHFRESERRGKLRPIVTPDGRDGSLSIHQDATIYASLLADGERVEHSFAPGRHAWVQVARGDVLLNGHEMRHGDGAAVSDERTLRFEGQRTAELLLFDLA